MVRAAGISISKNLAVIVGVGWYEKLSPGGRFEPFVLYAGKEMAVRIYTRDDGSAFRGCPYFKYWKSTGELYTHDESVEDLNFSRVISDFCRIYQCSVIGYNREEVPNIVSNGSLKTHAIPPGNQYEQCYLDILNEQTERSETKTLFPMNSCMEFMWGNLPLVDGKRALPTQQRPPYGRWDGTRALLNAVTACSVVQSDVWQTEAENSKWKVEPPPPPKYIWVKHPFSGYRKVSYWELNSVSELFVANPCCRSKFLFITSESEAHRPWRAQTEEELALAAEIETELRRRRL